MKSKLLIALVATLILTVVSPASAEFDCYADNVVNVQQAAVIWDEPGFSGRYIAWLEPGSDIRIVDWKQKSGKCWAQVEFVPDFATAIQHKYGWWVLDDRTLEDMQAYCEPEIDGDDAFHERIDGVLAYVQDEASYWHEYVMQYEYIIQPAEPGEATSFASWPDKCVEIGTRALQSDTELAYTLVHEACHIKQGYEGRWPDPVDVEATVRAEKECHAKALEMVLEIYPTDCKALIVRWMLQQDDSWWRAFVMGTCLPPGEDVSNISAVQTSVSELSFPLCMYVPLLARDACGQ